MELITAIDLGEVGSTEEEIKDWSYPNCWTGATVTTTQQTISVLISNNANCCEKWGYLTSVDDPTEFVGAALVGVTITDTALKTYDHEELDAGDIMFVNIETDRGTFQIALYNAHNGFYGHEAKVESRELNWSQRL
jgi:hypothetical protein